jgi:hypothetical protein
MYDVRFVAWPAFVHPASPQSPTPLLDHSSWCAPPPPPAVAGVWQGDVSLSFESDLEGVGRRRIFDIPAKPGEPGLLRSPVWFAVVGVVGEAGVETIVMAGRRGTGAGRTTGAAGNGVWVMKEGWV